MKKNVETKQDGKEFERFDDLLSKVVRVPKSEIDARDKAERKEKEQRKARKA